MKSIQFNKIIATTVALLSINNLAFSQNVGINATGASAHVSSMLDITSTTKGLLIPRMTSAQRTAITTPATGLTVYDTTLGGFYYYNGTVWVMLLNSNTGWSLLGNTGTNPTNNFIGTTDAVDFVTRTNNAERMRVLSTGNVGIGTSAPVSRLEVRDDASATALSLTNGTGGIGNQTGLDFYTYIGFGATARLGVVDEGSFSNNILFSVKEPFSTSNGLIERMRITSIGNVGIGTSNPVQNLSVKSTSTNVPGQASVSADDDHFLNIWSGSTADNDVALVVDNTQAMRFGNWDNLSTGIGWNEKMRIQANGNVGIGTFSPSQRLNVAGGSILTDQAYASSTRSVAANTAAFTTGAVAATQVRITNNASATANGNLTYGATPIDGQYLWITNDDAQAVNFSSAGAIVPAGKTMGFVYIAGAWKEVSASAASTTDWTLLGNAGTNASTNFIGTTDAIDVVVRTNNTEKMRVTSSGSVGIGTSAPSQRLSVTGGNILTDQAYASSTRTIAANTVAFNTSTVAATQVRITNNASATANGNLTYGATPIEGQYLWITNDDAQSVNFSSAGAIVPAGKTMGFVYVAGAWKEVSASAASTTDWTLLGNAGTVDGTNFIGTTDNVPLNIRVNNLEAGRISSGGQTAFGYQAASSNTATGISAFGLNALASNTGGSNNSAFGSSSLNSNIIGINNSAFGNQALQVTTGDGNTALGVRAGRLNGIGDNNTFVGFQSDASASTFTNATAIGANAIVGASNALILGNGANVGIGTSTPAFNLDVRSAGNTIINVDAGASSDSWTWYGQAGTLRGAMGMRNGGIMSFFNGGSDRMSILSNGNVGIGTIAPTNKLTVYQSSNTDGLTIQNTTGGAGSTSNLYMATYANLVAGTIRPGASISAIDAGFFSANLTFSTKIPGADANALAERMRITTDGDVGIGTTTPGGQFELSLNEGRKPGTNTWTVPSDERLKNIHGSYTKGLSEILKLNTITYQYKNVGERKFAEQVLKTNQVGFSAQEVQKIFPEAVGVDADGYLNFDMHSILVAYVNAIKELDQKDKAFEVKYKEQEKVNAKLNERLLKLEALLEKSK